MKKPILWGLFVMLLTPSVLNAQAWTKSKGTGFYKLDFANITATDVFNSTGDIKPYGGTLSQSIGSFYGEYGLTNKLTVGTYVPFAVSNTFKPTVGSTNLSSNGFGDVDVLLRYFLVQKSGISVSANLVLGLPTGDATKNNELVTGDGEFNQMLKLAAGTGGNRWWGQLALGFNNRSKSNSDEVRYDVEFGYKFFDGRFLTILKLNGVESIKNGTVKERTTGLFSNNLAYLGNSPEVLFYANKKKTFGLTARLGFAAKGQNVQAAPSVSGGVFAEF